MSSVTNIRLRVLPRFPARISGTDGIEVVRDGQLPDLIIRSAYEQLADISNIPDPNTTFFKVWNSATDEYTRIPYQAVFDNIGSAPGYATKAAAEVATIRDATHAIILYGSAAVGDGLGGLYIDTDTGSADTFVSGDGRTWYKAADVGEDRLVPALKTKVNGAMQKAVYDPQSKVGDAFPYDTKAIAAASAISANIHSIFINGSAAVGDGLGGLYIDTDTGSADTFTSNGGTRTWYRAADVSASRLVDAPAIRTFLALPYLSTAIGNDSTDDGPSINALLASVPEKSEIVFPKNRTYRIATALTTTKAGRIILNGAKFHIDANVQLLSADATADTEVKALTANYVAGALSFTVSAMSTVLKAGQAFKIFSNALDPADRDEGTNTNKYRTSEWAVAGEGCTSTNIVLMQPLRFVIGVDPTSVPGDEALINAYTTAMNARIIRPSSKTISVEAEGAEIYYTDGQSAVPWNSPLISLTGYYRPKVADILVTRGYGQGIELNGCYLPVVTAPAISNMMDDTSASQFGYGVSDSSYGTVANDGMFINCRHGYTSSNAACPTDDTSVSRMLRAGRTVGARISDCKGIGNGTSQVAQFDTHHSSEDVTFQNCYSEGMAGYGFNIRGRKISLINPIVRNCRLGVNVFTEFSSGDPDDDLWTNAKGVDYFTSARIVNPDVECETTPFNFSVATADISGLIRSRTAGHNQIKNVGSIIGVSGRADMRTSTLLGSRTATPETGVGIFDVTDVPASASAGISASTLIFSEGSDIYVDALTAADGANDLRGMRCDAGSSVQLRGRMNLRISNAFSQMFSTTGTYASTAGSDLQFLRTAGGTFTQNIAGKKVKIRSDDLTTNYNASPKGTAEGDRLLYINNNVNITHTGSTVENATVFVPPQPQTPYIDEAGHYQRVQLTVSKTGTAGAATITVRSSGSFNDSIVMAATDGFAVIDMEMWTRGDNVQRYNFDMFSANASGVAVSKPSYKDRTGDLSASGQFFRLGVTLANAADSITVQTCKITGDMGGVYT